MTAVPYDLFTEALGSLALHDEAAAREIGAKCRARATQPVAAPDMGLPASVAAAPADDLWLSDLERKSLNRILRAAGVCAHEKSSNSTAMAAFWSLCGTIANMLEASAALQQQAAPGAQAAMPTLYSFDQTGVPQADPHGDWIEAEDHRAALQQRQAPAEQIAAVILRLIGECVMDWKSSDPDDGFDSWDEEVRVLVDLVNKALVKAEAAPAPGYKLVPIEPTPEMIAATAYGERATFANSAAYRDYKAMVAAAPVVKAEAAPAPSLWTGHHPDDEAVRRFAAAMMQKMRASREKGRHGWDDEMICPTERLQAMLLDHVAKGDPVDVANFCMMLWTRGAPVAAPAPTAEPVDRIIHLQFLTDVVTAAGLLSHGKRDKGLARRISDRADEIRGSLFASAVGQAEAAAPVACEECDGKGQKRIQSRPGSWRQCSDCNGSGIASPAAHPVSTGANKS
jgi:hypothetical protein